MFCKEHSVEEQECGVCQPQLAELLKPGQSLKVRFVSKVSTIKAGVKTSKPRKVEAKPQIEAFCTVDYNKYNLAQITPLAKGVIKRVKIEQGAFVEAGAVLAEVLSADVAQAKAHYLATIVDHEAKEVICKREKNLSSHSISAVSELQEANLNCKKSLLEKRTAHQKLLNFGFTNTEIKTIEERGDSSSILSVRAPFRGTLIERKAVMGEAVQPGDALFTLANLDSYWLKLSIPTDLAVYLRTGTQIEATFNSLIGIKAKGTLNWIGTAINSRSRMLNARAIVQNPQNLLKVGLFGKANIFVGESTTTLRVPKNAIQTHENKTFIFVKIEDDLYGLQRVILGRKIEQDVNIIAGIQENDEIVVGGSFIVMSEFLKSRLGAGCVDD